MNDTKISSDDPKLTAYALGELEGEERLAVEAALEADPAARAAVEEIRAMAAQLSTVLATEPMETTLAQSAKPHKKSPGKLLRFPQLYFVIGGLAAACFAVVIALNENNYEAKEAMRVQKREKWMQEAKLMQESKARSYAMQMPVAERPEPMATAMDANSAPQLVARGEGVLMDTAGSRALGGLMKDDREAPGGIRNRFNTEAYAFQRENDFLGAAENPLSTFSIDVDTASYANVRRFLQVGQRPPVDAVRIEELVNYFPYRYAPPTGEVPFAASMEVASAPWAPEHRLVRIGLKGREVSTAQRGRANLVFLLDVSGSMNEPNKLPLVKESMRLLVGKLRVDDRVAIVTYADGSGLALPSTPVARAREIIAALDGLAPGGSTNGAMGIQLAYDVAKANAVEGGINRVILCTDGDFNVGVTSEGELTRLIEEKAKSGVFLTVLGFGMGNYKDATLEKLADKGNGNYGYIDTRREAEKMLVEQVSGTLVTIAKDVKIQVEFNPTQVASYRLIGYENRMLKKEDFNNDKIDAGEIGAGHTVTALYEIVPAGAVETKAGAAPAVDELKYARAVSSNIQAPTSKSGELLTLKVRYKEPAGEVSRKLKFVLTDRGAGFAAASGDFKFAAAVAGFGMILRDSAHKGTVTLAEVEAWAEEGAGDDAGGYRSEFIGLAKQAETLLR